MAEISGVGGARRGLVAGRRCGFGRGGGRALAPRTRRGADTDRAADAGAAEPAVAPWVLLEVLLVVVLGVVERARRRDLGRDLRIPGGPQPLREGVTRRLGHRALPVARPVDRRAVLGPDVVALAHALGGVVVLPEQAQDLLV